MTVRQWRLIEELSEVAAERDAEFAGAFAGVDAVGRRAVLKAMTASLAAAGLAGCSAQADRRALPYVEAPDSMPADAARFYATSVVFMGYAQPVLGETHAGRPTKLEGAPDHPSALGAADAYTQAALLGLYDPDRSKEPRRMGRPASWAAFDRAVAANARALDARGGEGFRLLTGRQTSPTMARQLAALQARWPKARWHVFEAIDHDARSEALRQVFGRDLEAHPRLDRAEVVVSLDDDLIGPGPRQVRHARQWSARRRAFHNGQGRAELLVAEPIPSLTGVAASDRLIVSHARIPQLAQAIAARLGVETPEPSLAPGEAAWADRAASALLAAKGAGLISVGAHHAPEVQALALLANHRLGALGRTVVFTAPLAPAPPDGARSLAVLAADMAAGRVDTLAIIDANPAYAAPPDLGFSQALARARLVVHAGFHFDETAVLAHWHAPLLHDLEGWSDARSVDGLASIVQPLVRPLFGGRSRHALLQALQGDLAADDHALVADTWRAAWGAGFEPRWTRAIWRGFVEDSAPPEIDVAPAAAAAQQPAATAESGLTVVFRPDPSLWDGRFANNAWLQELPKPLSKLTWDNAIGVSPTLAREKGLANGDVVRLAAGGRVIEGPVWITPGQERRTVSVFLGYGRRTPGQLGDRHGYDAYALRSGGAWALSGATLEPTGRKAKLATTQIHTRLDGFDFVRRVGSDEAAAIRQGPPSAETQPTLYPPKAYDRPSWGMSIDTDLCIGCNACVTACDAENNIPMVGKDQVAMGREMHWLRIDLYHEGPPEAPQSTFQPVPCMHCEQAPCEMGCPVNAAVHSPDGLNLQVYNRCIGTRTCSSFCPYKVRHFNWFDFTRDDPPELQAARNPEVTVRSRGVMEKCTYCIQRISAARIQAKIEGRPIRDGEVKTACQQTCPTEAISFGDILDPDSAVSRRKRLKRDYALLEEVNTRPRTTYLARIERLARIEGRRRT
jgi:molybdopterin-containing oxidoreductase family iron-sulfur binding subunit